MTFLDPVSESAEQKKSSGLFLLVAGVCLCIGIFQFWKFPFINLAEGLGYDGVWYFQPANEFLPKTDNYHIFRLFPPTMVYFLKKIIFQAHLYFETVKAFQVYNLICNVLSFWLAYKTGRQLKFSGLQLMVFFTFLFVNFHVLKDEIFNPVMTDTTILMLSLLLLWSYLSGKFWLYIPASVLMMFTFPIGGFILQIIFILHFSGPSAYQKLIPENWLKLLISTISVVFILLTAFVVYGMGRLTVLTFPDAINPFLFPLSLTLAAFAMYRILRAHSGLFQNLVQLARHPFAAFNRFSLVLIAEIILYLILPSINQFPAKGFTGNFTIAPLIYVTLKPLIGVFDNVMFFGPVMVIFLMNLPVYLKNSCNDSASLLASLCVCIFALKPEARHSIFLLPIISIVAIKSFPSVFWTTKNVVILTGICLVFSKFWYPCHWAVFPPGYEIFTSKVNHAIFQEFPIQHYFMFQGPMISHQNYFLWLLVILPLVWYCYRILNPEKQGSNSGEIAKTRSISRP